MSAEEVKSTWNTPIRETAVKVERGTMGSQSYLFADSSTNHCNRMDIESFENLVTELGQMAKSNQGPWVPLSQLQVSPHR